MKPYRPSKESKFWVKSGNEIVPVTRKAFVDALKRQASLKANKKS